MSAQSIAQGEYAQTHELSLDTLTRVAHGDLQQKVEVTTGFVARNYSRREMCNAEG